MWLAASALVRPYAWGNETGLEGPSDLAGDDAPVRTEEIVVSATRTKELVTTVPGSPTILTRADIEETPYRGGHQVDDLLRYVPGVQPSTLSSRYNHPTAQAISLRGLGSRRALVLLDGIPLNDGFGGWINWGMVPDNVQRIEVVQGGGSNLYGTWAMGGVIHLLSEPVRTGKAATVTGQAGNLDTYTTSVLVRGGADRVGLSLGYRWYHSNGFITVPKDQRGPIDDNDDSRHQHFAGSLAFSLNPRTEMTISGNFFREDRSFGTPLRLATRTIGTAALGLTGETPHGDQWETKAFAQWQTFRNKTSVVTPSATVRLSEFRDQIQTIPSNDFGGLAQWTTQLRPGHRLVIGTDARAIIGQSEDELFSMTGPMGRRLARGKQVGWGVFGEWIATPVDRLTVIPSFRTDWWKNFDGRLESEDATITRPPDNVETALNPKLATQYRLTDGLRAGASVYRAFRAPTLNELYRGFGFAGFSFLPNPRLSPERLWGVDTTIEASLLPKQRLTIRTTAHYEEVKDQILFVPQGPVSVMRDNVGRTRTIGVDLDLLFRVHHQVTVKVGYAYADSTIRSFSPDPTIEGNRIPNVSRHQVIAGLVFGHPEQIQLTVLGRYLSRQFADVQNDQPVADFVALDASLRTHIGEHLQLFLDAENLTDRDYIATQTGPIKTLGVPRLVVGGIRLDY